MNDLEDRLRADFQQATAGVEDTTDAEAALLAGQRARSSRRVARTVGAAALATVLGLLGWGVLRTAPILGGHPDPMGTISAVPIEPTSSGSPYVPTDPMSTTFDLSSEGFGGKGPDYDSITFTIASRTSRSYSGTVTLVKAGHRQATEDFSAPFGTSWSLPWDRHLLIGAVPGRVSWLDIVSTTTKGIYSNQQEITGVGMTAFWAYFEEADGPGWSKGFLWQTVDGAIGDSSGKSVPGAQVVLKDRSFVVYRDEDLDVVGIRATGDGNSYSNRISDSKPADLVQGGLGRSNGDGTWDWTQYGVLPAGAHDISVELSDPDGEWASAAMSDGRIAVVANSPRRADTTDVIRSISYSDAAGKLVTYRK
ncbi:MAG TPA: hypothetical protein VGK18_03320 [Propionicimonas sp.]|jgi:hypothetical protein|uniref:hypothetical protein n=1 Tax=Propionicimonas sp. TaxID=1955623 RepID=UPI002F3E325F